MEQHEVQQKESLLRKLEEPHNVRYSGFQNQVQSQIKTLEYQTRQRQFLRGEKDEIRKCDEMVERRRKAQLESETRKRSAQIRDMLHGR